MADATATERTPERGALAYVRGEMRPALLLALAVLVAHLAVSGRYGFHRDELYYVIAGRNPAFGYVDHPPVVPLLAGGIDLVAGGHLWPLRLVAGVAHTAIVIITALIARDLGGRRVAIALAALGAATAPVLMAVGSLFQTVIFEQLLAALILLLVVRILRGADGRWWLAVGALLGLALETKWTIALLVVSLAGGFLLVPACRRHLRSIWLWAGALVAVLLWVPNLVWQAANDWPTLEFAANSNSNVQDDGGRFTFVVEQFLLPGPLAVPLLVAGLLWLWRSRQWRVFGIATGILVLGLLVIGGKSYYAALIYPLVFAAGAVAAEAWAETRRRRVLVVVALASGLVVLPAMAPVAPRAVYRDLFQPVNDELAEEFGWPELADQVAAVHTALPEGEQAEARIVTASYGEAAALQLYGPERGIPEASVLTGHNSYDHWWPEGEPTGTVIFVRYPPARVTEHCGQVEGAGRISNAWDVENQTADTPIVVCRDLQTSPDDLQDDLRHYE